MTCIIGCDHAGLEFLKVIVETFSNHKAISKIVEIYPNSNKVDYPDYAKLVCNEVLGNQNSFGILICGSGIGMSMCANKISGIRAALCVNEYMAKYARAHNNANVLCLGERVIGVGLAIDIVHTFINSTFEGGRHQLRVDKMEQLR